MLYISNVPYLGLSGVLVFGQVDPRDGAKRSEKFLQVSLTGVLRQIGHTNSSIVISCGAKRKQVAYALEERVAVRLPSSTNLTHLFGWAAWTPLVGCLRPSGWGAHTSRSYSEQVVQVRVQLLKLPKGKIIALKTYSLRE